MGVIGTKQRVFFRTQAQFDALSAPQKIDGALYYIYDRGKLYQYDGTASKFINYAGSFEILAERPTTPIVGKLYIIGAPGAYKLEFYFGGTWETIGGNQTSNNIDGGRADEIYQQNDLIDGGNANG